MDFIFIFQKALQRYFFSAKTDAIFQLLLGIYRGFRDRESPKN